MSVSADRAGKGYAATCTLISTGIILLILGMLLFQSGPAITANGLDMFSTVWDPPSGQYGILSMMYGTAIVTLIAIFIAVPLGILSAVLISEILPSAYRIPVKSVLEILAGIPSIIYGLIGVAILGVWIGNIFDLQTGRTLFTGGIILGIMILPIVTTLSEDALHNIPGHYREAGIGLGLYKYEIVKSTLLPIAMPDIAGAVLLGVGRALGETMAMMLVIGSIDRIPEPVINILVPGQTITSKLGREIAESAFGSLHFSSLICLALILMIIVLIITMAAQKLIKNGDRLYE